MGKLTGGCQCGAVRFEVDGDVRFTAVCHCPSCRKSAGAPLVGWAMFDLDAVTCDRSGAASFASSPGVKRTFCATCGSALFFEADYLDGLIDITTESFDDPDAVVPTAQIWTDHETSCLRHLASMIRFDTLPPND